MTDGTIQTPATDVNAAPVSAPAASAPPNPAPEAAASPASTAAPAESAPVVETKPPEPSLLGGEPPKEEPKPAETPKEGEKPAEQKDMPTAPEKDAGGTTKEEASQSVEPAPLPAYEFTLPEGFKPDDAQFDEFKKKVGSFELETKADHAKFQSFAQDLLNQHTTALKDTAERLNNYYQEAFEKQGNDWKDAFEKDPEIGGNRRDTTLKNATSFIRAFGGTPEQQQQLRTLMNDTKIGNNPALIRLLANAGAVLAEGKPVPATKPPVAQQSKVDKRYGVQR